MSRPNAICPVCQQVRRATPGHENDTCRRCRRDEADRIALPEGDWRYDPFTHVRRYVYADPNTTVPDAFDEPIEPKPKRRVGRPIEIEEHGTIAGARAHERRKEPVCSDCNRARTEYRHQLIERRRAEGDPRYVCPCGSGKSRNSTLCDPCERRNRWSKTQGKDAA